MRNPMYQIILETAKGDASVQSIIEDRGMPETWALDMAEQAREMVVNLLW